MLPKFLALAGLILLHAIPAEATSLTVDKHVSIMRHGVRPQTSSKKLDIYPQKDWPHWDVADGMLTAHGAAATQRLGQWEVAMLRNKGLIAPSGCPAPGSVFGWANGAVQRTIETGDVLLESMFPGCGLHVGYNHVQDVDPLYAASDAALGAVDPERAKAAILAAAGGSLDVPRARAEPLMRELDAIMGCEAADSPCSMTRRPWKIKVDAADGDQPAGVSVKGPIADAGTLVELFLLQYANGFPMQQVAFGRLKGPEDIIRLSALRQMKYDVGNRVPYLAARDTSNFLNQILLALTGDPDGPPDAPFVLFMASDTQQAEVAAMLGLHWQLAPYVNDETPPTGALTFERLHDETGRAYVRLGFIAPTLDQIRAASVIDDGHPPLQTAIALPGCEAETIEGACPLDRFLQISRATLDTSAVGAQHYR